MSKKPRQRVSGQWASARITNLRVSPTKLSLVAATIRGLEVDKALAALSFSRRRIARDVAQVVQSALANAENNHQLDVDHLYVDRVEVGKAMTIKRWRPRARGRAARIIKYFSNLKVVLRQREEGSGGTKS